MQVSLKSTGSGFAALASKLDRLADDAPRKMAERAAAAAQGQLDREFATTTDPAGKRWKPKKIPNGKPTLQATGDMMASAKAIPGPTNDILLSVEGPAVFHQHGTVHMVARPILPDNKLRGEWMTAIDAAAVEGIHDAYEGR